MDKIEYQQKNVIHVKFPSGLELDIGLPNGADVLFNSGVFKKEKMNDFEITQEIIKRLKFPEDWSYADLNVVDLLYLGKLIGNFFTEAVGSLDGS